MTRTTFHITGWLLLAAAGAAQAQTPPAPPGRPSDAQVRQDIWRDGRGMLDFKTTAGKSGELEWDARSRTWFFQKQLTTFNRYTGIPAPADAELLDMARAGIDRHNPQSPWRDAVGLPRKVLAGCGAAGC